MSRLDDLRSKKEMLEENIAITYDSLDLLDIEYAETDAYVPLEKSLRSEQNRLEVVNKAIAEEEQRIAAANAQQARLDYIPRSLRNREDEDEDWRRRAYLGERDRLERRARNHESYHQREHTSHDPRCPYERGY